MKIEVVEVIETENNEFEIDSEKYQFYEISIKNFVTFKNEISKSPLTTYSQCCILLGGSPATIV